MPSDCGEARLSLGAYVLGALSRPDCALVDAHLRTCADCRTESRSMNVLPGLLAQIQESEIPIQAESSPELLDRVLAAVAQRRQRSHRVYLTASIAAGAILATSASVALHLTDRVTHAKARMRVLGDPTDSR
jgi:predicted anti-sigma-YlaC factor YlaD